MTATLRERREDFATATAVLDGLSLDRRPGALAWDYRTAFAPGPRAVGDASAGLLARAWRTTAGPADVRLAPAADGGGAWQADTVLFAYSGAPIGEVGLAFDQNARPVVCAERATGPGGAAEVWLYRYDPVDTAYVFTSLGAGRTPRVLLDEPLATSGSDVLLFYVSDAADAVVVRQQRDRYAAVAPTTLTGAAGCFLETAARDLVGRVRLVAARADAAAGTWTLDGAASALYPVRTAGAEDPLTAAASVLGAEVRLAVLTPSLEVEPAVVQHALRSVVVADPTIARVVAPDSQAVPGHALTEVLVRPLVFRVDTHDPTDGGHQPAHTLRGLQVQTLVISHRQPADTDQHVPAHALSAIQVKPLIHAVSQPADAEQHLPSLALTGIQVKPLIRTVSVPAEAEQHLPSHALSSIAVVYLVRDVRTIGEPTLTENQYAPGFALRSISVGP